MGEAVTDWKKGDRVGVGWFGGHCGSCSQCKEDQWVCCEKGKITGAHITGGFAEYMGKRFALSILIPTSVSDAEALARLPEGMTFEEAGPLMCAGLHKSMIFLTTP